jgi:hypothetical protein
MLVSLVQGEMFGSTFDLKTIGADKLPKDILIPGRSGFHGLCPSSSHEYGHVCGGGGGGGGQPGCGLLVSCLWGRFSFMHLN